MLYSSIMSKQNLKIIFSLIILMLPNFAWGAPSISGVSGTVSDGQSVTICGIDFGTKYPSEPYLWAPFEGSFNPSILGVKNSWDANENMVYTSNEGVGGTGGAKASNDSGIWTLAINSSGFNWNDYNQQIYIFRKKKLNFDPGSINWKVWRMWPNEFEQPDIYIATNNGCAYTEGVMESCKYFDGDTFRGTTNSWDSEEIIFKGNSSFGTADGILRLYSDGVSAGNLTNMQYKNGAGEMTSNYVVHFVKANATLGIGDRVWIDDVYVDTTWARVMIGNNSTWSSSTHKEPFIPSVWTDENITAIVNTGTFILGQSAYLYVVDENGEVNTNGFPVVIDSSDAIVPNAPTGLGVL